MRTAFNQDILGVLIDQFPVTVNALFIHFNYVLSFYTVKRGLALLRTFGFDWLL